MHNIFDGLALHQRLITVKNFSLDWYSDSIKRTYHYFSKTFKAAGSQSCNFAMVITDDKTQLSYWSTRNGPILTVKYEALMARLKPTESE